ncbi:MAG: type II toxin-antitoxin system RelB/DinJ family antitoxin [Flexilinea sp.]|nr:type II toxin-antitoxin system RelB/DinJ family antitoxin [Flexilinea sp.]
MATSLLQVRIEDTLKEDAARVFDNLGIDTSTAIRMFLKRSVMENGIPFRMTLPRQPYRAERGYRAMLELGESARENGLSDISLDEINAEIAMSRSERIPFVK